MSLQPHSCGAVTLVAIALFAGCRERAATNAEKATTAPAATMSAKDEWPFSEPKNLAVITIDRIVDGRHPILYVSHDADDGGWQFLDGGIISEKDARVVSLQEMLESDPTLREISNLPLGWTAEREAVGKPWRRSEFQ